MAGKNCVAVACDMRYGAQMQTMAIDKNKVFKMHDRCEFAFQMLLDTAASQRLPAPPSLPARPRTWQSNAEHACHYLCPTTHVKRLPDFSSA